MKRNYWVMTCTTAMMALAVSVALAGQPAAGLSDQGQSQGRGRGQGQGQAQGRGQARTRFDDKDRQATNTWYSQHQRSLPPGLRDRDRLPPGIEMQIQEGFVIDRSLRGRVHSVPSTLLRLLFPAPRNYRYVVIGGHIVLIDSGYRVYDVIHVGHGR